MTGATGNIYCGLHEFVEMAFLLHLLRAGDLFLDIGANIGSYTVLASKVCTARTVAFEPDSQAASVLAQNIILNDVDSLATVHQIAVGEDNGEIAFTTGLDTMNRVARPDDTVRQVVRIARLDDIDDAAMPTLVKLDVEGYEERVLAGADRVLGSPSLLAVQSELFNPEVASILGSFGFRRSFYQPFSRKLGPTSFGFRTSNALFVRNEGAVAERLAAAPRRKILGKYL